MAIVGARGGEVDAEPPCRGVASKRVARRGRPVEAIDSRGAVSSGVARGGKVDAELPCRGMAPEASDASWQSSLPSYLITFAV